MFDKNPSTGTVLRRWVHWRFVRKGCRVSRAEVLAVPTSMAIWTLLLAAFVR